MATGRPVEVGEILDEGPVDGWVAAGDVAGGGLVSGEPDQSKRPMAAHAGL